MSEPKKFMGRQEILDAIKDLASSQGLYARIYDTIMYMKEDDPKQYETYMDHLVAQHFSDSVDLVLFFEC